MVQLFNKFFLIKTIKLILRLLASLASAILLVSGYLFFISITSKSKDNDTFEKDSTNKESSEKDENGKED